MSVKYEPKIIQKYADKLYSQANSIAVSYGFLGAILGAIAGFLAAKENGAVIGALIACILGISAGINKGAELRLKAQEVLCQMHLEWNTRSLRAAGENKDEKSGADTAADQTM